MRKPIKLNEEQLRSRVHSMLILLEMKIQPPVLVWWTCDSRSLHFPVWPSLELLSRRHELSIQDSWHVSGFHGWLRDRSTTTDNLFLLATIKTTCRDGNHTLKTTEVQARLETLEKKRQEQRAPGANKFNPGFTPPFYSLVFLLLLFESHCSLWGGKSCWRTNSSKSLTRNSY